MFLKIRDSNKRINDTMNKIGETIFDKTKFKFWIKYRIMWSFQLLFDGFSKLQRGFQNVFHLGFEWIFFCLFKINGFVDRIDRYFLL